MDVKNKRKSAQNIAIVGIGCRFAGGVDDVDKLWEVLEQGIDCSTPHPESRYDASYFVSPGEKLPGKMYNLRGSYLKQDPFMFDRNFFKMSPSEAQHLDPTIRLLLEVTWEALEDAGIAASDARGSHTGVYVGGMYSSEYRNLLIAPIHNIGQYTNSGNTGCMIANRVSYEFDFRGPSIGLDTACSSSLTAIFLACEALKTDQCSMAVAGGANLMLLPEAMVGLSQAGMVSPDGRSKSFDKTADGYGRGEGFGIVVLKTLEDAVKSNDRIHAIIRGGALSNDGRTTGIIAPSADAQRALLQTACVKAGISPNEVTYAEAHGTGTAIGDKTEASVLGEVLGQSRSREHPPLHVGSIKSNLGHTEGAAGVAGIIKIALCFKHRMIPKVVHFNTPNPELDFNQLNLYVPKVSVPWPVGEPLIATCSSFGFGGSNACMIVEAPDTTLTRVSKDKVDASSSISTALLPMLISASTGQALQQRISDWVGFLQHPEIKGNEQNFRNALYTAQRSNHHQHRIAFIVSTAEEAIGLLQRKLDDDGDVTAKCVEGVARSGRGMDNIVFVFSGMGTQWWAMARELMQTERVFSDMIRRIADLLRKYGSKWSLVSMLAHEGDKDKINETEIAQPCICAVQIALVELWRSRCLVPDVVVGHSVGEVAAAYCSGLLSLHQAVGLIYHRGRQLRKTDGSGKMMAVLHPAKNALDIMQSKRYDKVLDVAAVNSPNQVVISGDSRSIDDIMAEYKATNIRCVQLKVRNAFHSRQQNCLEEVFKAKISKPLRSKRMTNMVTCKSIPMISTVTGRYLTQEEATSPEYWWKNVRRQVLFKTSVETLVNEGNQIFVEIGSHPALTPAIRETINELRSTSLKLTTCGSLSRPRDTTKPAEDRFIFLQNHTKLYVSGVSCDFESYFKAMSASVVSIPKYPWQRELCSAIPPDVYKDSYQFPVTQHPLLGEKVELHTSLTSSTPVTDYKSKLTKSSVPWLKDHVIGGSIILPAAAFIEVAVAVARKQSNDVSPTTLRNVQLQRFMFVPESEGMLETTAQEMTPSRTHVTVRSFTRETGQQISNESGQWIQHMEADIEEPHEQSVHTGVLEVEAICKRCDISITPQTQSLIRDASGLTFGPSFQTSTHAFVNEECSEILSYCEAPEVIRQQLDKYLFHPALLDGCLQSYAYLAGFKLQQDAAKKGIIVHSVKQVPSSFKSFTLYRKAPKKIIVHVEAFRHSDTGDVDDERPHCHIKIADADTKEVIAEVKKLQFRKFQTDIQIEALVWSTKWINLPNLQPQVTGHQRYLILSDKSGIGEVVRDRLEASRVKTLIQSTSDDEAIIEKYYKENSSPPFTDILVVRTLDMSEQRNQVHTDATMSLDEFRAIQDKFPRFCISLILEITALSSDIWPRVIFLTAGAQAICPGEIANPFMAEIQALVMTIMHEEPKLRAVSVDLPGDVDATEASATIHQACLNLPDDENMLAYRRQIQADGSTSMCLVAPRLQFDPVTHFRIETPNTMWIIQQTEKKAKLSLQPTVKGTSQTSNGKQVVKLQSFCIIPITTDDSSHVNGLPVEQPSTLLTMYSGFRNGDISSSSKGIIGIANCTATISSVMTMEKSNRNYVEIPYDLTCLQAMSIVKKYLPAQIFFQHVFPLTLSTKVMFLRDADTSDSAFSFAIFASAKGAHVLEVSVGNDVENRNQRCEERDGHLTKAISIDDVKRDEEATVDLLIVPMAGSRLQKQVPLISPKLTKTSTVLYLSDGEIRPSTITFGKPGTKHMSFSTSLPVALSGQTQQSLLTAMTDIFEVAEHCHGSYAEEFRTSSQKSEISELSGVAMARGNLPKLTTITCEGDTTALPVELYQDLWRPCKDESYLVTGGTSGFGVSVVKWLVTKGAKHIFVASRSTPSDEIFRSYADDPGKVRIQHIMADLSNVSDVEGLFATIQKSTSPALAGIFHLATQYRDGFLNQTSKTKWDAVLEGKAYGALLLHQVTQKLKIPLKYFFVTSSIVSLMGNAGQGNYCAANKFLNSLCQMRNHMGLPATALCIGYINSVGYAASNNLVKFGEERGMMSITPEDVLRGMSIALSTDTTVMGFGGPLILRRFMKLNKNFMKHHFNEVQGRFSLYKNFFEDLKDVSDDSDGSFKQLLLDKSDDEVKILIATKLGNILSQLLSVPEGVDTDVSLPSVGLDSLMASSMSEAIFDHFEVNVASVSLINDSMTIQTLKTQIFEELLKKDTAETTTNNEINVRENHNSTNSWIYEGPNFEGRRLVMVCFPPTGEGRSYFTPWSSQVSQFGGQLLIVQYPGSEGREREQPLQSLQEIVDGITDALIDKLDDRKFIIFGHSVGSLIGFETAQQLLSKHNLRPIHVFLSSWYAPTLPYPHPKELENVNANNFSSLRQTLESSKESVNVLASTGLKLSFLDDTVLGNRFLFLRMLPSIESVFNIIQTYRCQPREPLPCGMTVYGGNKDRFVSPRLLGDWKYQIARGNRFTKKVLDGGHMYILAKTEEVLKNIGRTLQRLDDANNGMKDKMYSVSQPNLYVPVNDC